MSISFRLAVGLAVLSLAVACNQDHAEPIRPVPSRSSKLKTSSNELALKALRTGEAIDPRANDFTLKAEAKTDTTQVDYEFNSEERTAFALLSAERKVDCSDGRVAETHYILASDAAKVEIHPGAGEVLELKPATKYVLSLVVDMHSCSHLELAYSLVAWADVADAKKVKPELARICQGTQPQELTFFPRLSGRVYETSGGGRKVFIDHSILCGEKRPVIERVCKWAEPGAPEPVICDPPISAEEGKAVSDVAADGKSVKVSCLREGQTIFSGLFDNCQERILDFTDYEPK